MTAGRKRNRRSQTLLQLVLFAGILVLVNILANARLGNTPLYTYVDLTEEKRYTLTEPTKELLRELDDVVYAQVLLEGKFNAGFKRLQTSVRDMLDDFRSESAYLEYEFEDPATGSVEEINARRKELAKDGIVPVNLRLKEATGTKESLIYPYAIFYYKGRSAVVKLLENEVPGVNPEIILNNSIALLEYKFANAIQKLQNEEKPNIVFTAGQGELDKLETKDLENNLRQYYDTGRINLDSVVNLPEEIAAVIVAKPTRPFDEKDKFKLDQYVMNGGKVLWLIDHLDVNLDSLRGRREFFPSEMPVDLDDLLFRFGIRILPNLVLDLQCTRIPLATGQVGNAPQFDYFRYPYHIVAVPDKPHPVVKGLDAVNLLYASTIDTTVQAKYPLRKTVLLSSSENSMMQFLPVGLNFEFLRYDLQAEKFNKPPQPMALLLEGEFASLYENRVTEEMMAGLEAMGLGFRAKSPETSMMVVSDGDIIKNPVNRERGEHGPLGFNAFERYTFANKEFILNALEYLLYKDGVIEARGKEVKLRLLNKDRSQREATYWQLLNIGVPLLLLVAFGILFQWWRRRRYGRVRSAS